MNLLGIIKSNELVWQLNYQEFSTTMMVVETLSHLKRNGRYCHNADLQVDQ